MSKNLILYFSGTGNSLAAAKGMERLLGDAEVFSIISLEENFCIPSDVETVGFVYPIYMNAVPKVMVEFIKRIKIDKKCFVYGLATHGGRPGKAGCHLHKICKDWDIELKAYFQLCMINNTPKGVAPFILMRLDWEKEITEEKVMPILKRAEEEMDSIAGSIKRRDASSLEKITMEERGFGYLMMKQVWKLSEGSNPKLQFLVDGACTGCGICEKVCPANCIKLQDGKPQWAATKCMYCYACFNFCPAQAIGVRHYTKKQGRYHHPSIDWKQIAAAGRIEQK